MKKLATAILLVMISGLISAQSLVSDAFSDYEGNEDYTRVSISKKMFSLLASLDPDDEDEKELIESISKIDGLKIIVADSSANPNAMYKESLTRIPSRFEELMTVDDKDEKIVFMIDEKEGMVSELIMVMKGDDEFVLLDLYGEIDLKEIAKISRQMNIDHLDKLEKIEEK